MSTRFFNSIIVDTSSTVARAYLFIIAVLQLFDIIANISLLLVIYCLLKYVRFQTPNLIPSHRRLSPFDWLHVAICALLFALGIPLSYYILRSAAEEVMFDAGYDLVLAALKLTTAFDSIYVGVCLEITAWAIFAMVSVLKQGPRQIVCQALFIPLPPGPCQRLRVPR